MGNKFDLSGNVLVVEGIEVAGTEVLGSDGTIPATAITVAADAENGITADDLQAALSELAARVQALEDAV